MSYLVSPRGHALLLVSLPRERERPVLCVEAYTKWYNLYVVCKAEHGYDVQEVPFPESNTLTPYVDHVPNPQVVKAWADSQGYWIDDLSLEMLVGRWMLYRNDDHADLLETDGE